MIYNLYSIRDSKTVFSEPVPCENDTFAIRGFFQTCSRIRADRNLYVTCDDLDFYCIGTFDSVSGLVTPLVAPRFLCSGTDARVRALEEINHKEVETDET